MKVFRGPTESNGEMAFASWGFLIKQPVGM